MLSCPRKVTFTEISTFEWVLGTDIFKVVCIISCPVTPALSRVFRRSFQNILWHGVVYCWLCITVAIYQSLIAADKLCVQKPCKIYMNALMNNCKTKYIFFFFFQTKV